MTHTAPGRRGTPAVRATRFTFLTGASQAASAVMLALLLTACGDGGSRPGASGPVPAAASAPLAASAWQWNLPDYFPPPAVPADNPMSAEKVALGRFLFYDKRLSGNGTQACASCHQQAKAFTDGKALAVGSKGEVHPRSAMALVNVAWNATNTWANPTLISLERQIPNPIFGETPPELGVNDDTVVEVLNRLRAAKDVNYPKLFEAAFPDKPSTTESPNGDPVTWNRIMKAITTFERTLISVNSRYDQHLQGKASLTPAELHGLKVFKDAQCVKCHEEPNFTNQFRAFETDKARPRYYNKGLYNVGGKGDYPWGNQGEVELTGNLEDMGKFKTPTLRNIEVTAPYGHDGSLATLEEAVDVFTRGGRVVTSGPNAGDGRANPHKSKYIKDRQLSAQDKADLVAFLKTLTDQGFLTNPQLSDPFVTKP